MAARPSPLRGRRGGTLVEYLVIVAAILGVVVLAFSRFSAAARSATDCDGAAVATLGSGGAANVPCGHAAPIANAATPQAIATTAGAPSPPGALTCDALGCRATSGAVPTPAAVVPAPEPPPTDYDAVKYTRIAGAPFVTGKDHDRAVHPADISQGAIADCYFVSSLASLANVRPELLQGNIQSLGDDRYAVRIFAKGKWKTLKIKNEFPTVGRQWSETDKEWKSYDNKGPLYMHPGQTSPEGGAELWPMLYERAYAKANGGYDAIGHGGSAGDSLTALTGQPSTTTNPNKMTFETFAGYVNAGYAVVSGTLSKPAPGVEDHELFKTDKIAHWHAYWVQSVDMKNQTVTLRDPWGWDVHVVTLTWDQYKAVVSNVYTNPVTPRTKKWFGLW